MTLSKMIHILLVTFSLAAFPVSPALSGSNNFERNNLPVEKQYPAVKLQKGNVDTDGDFNEGNKNTEEKWKELNTDRPGGDYRNFWSSGGASSCREACEKDPRCRSYTFVKPGFQGKEGRCFLKSFVPAPKKNRCCISGIKEDIPADLTKKLSQPMRHMTKPDHDKKSLPKTFQPVLTPNLQAFKQSVINKIQNLKTKERGLKHERIRNVQEEIRSRSESKRTGSLRLACSTPQITSVWPSQVSPGWKILIKGCGFSEYQEQAILYDPTGKWLVDAVPGADSSKTIDNNSTPISIEKWSDTEIHGVIMRPQLLFEPRKVHIKIKRENQWSNPSPEISLEPNYDYYVCNQFPFCKPIDIQTNGTTTVVTPGGLCETATIYHMFAGNGLGGAYGTGGLDTLVQNMKLSKFFTFVQIWLTPEPLKLTSAGKWEPIEGSIYSDEYQLKANAEIEQNLDYIEGKTFVSKVTVKWGAAKKYGISYSYAIVLRGPEGWANIPF